MDSEKIANRVARSFRANGPMREVYRSVELVRYRRELERTGKPLQVLDDIENFAQWVADAIEVEMRRETPLLAKVVYKIPHGAQARVVEGGAESDWITYEVEGKVEFVVLVADVERSEIEKIVKRSIASRS